MRILPVSDLHLEFLQEDEIEKLVGSLPEVDVLVMAGDIFMARYLDSVRDDIRHFIEKFPEIVYIPGNHEYYKSSPDETNGLLRVLEQESPRFHLLRPEAPVTINGTRFVGGTMWFPQKPNSWLGPKIMNDYRLIRDFTPWVYNENTRFREEMNKIMLPTDIVVTHHLPHPMSVSQRFHGDIGNIFFLSDEERLILDKQPRIWIHGHTHDSKDYRIKDTRVVCNPKGYPYESETGFNPNLILEV